MQICKYLSNKFLIYYEFKNNYILCENICHDYLYILLIVIKYEKSLKSQNIN